MFRIASFSQLLRRAPFPPLQLSLIINKLVTPTCHRRSHVVLINDLGEKPLQVPK